MLGEFTRIIREEIVSINPWHKGAPTFVLLTDPTTGNCSSISLWETEDHRKALDTSPFLQEQLTKIAHHFTAPPVREVCEVALEEMPQGNRARYARVMIGHTQPNQLDEAIRLVREVFLPEFQKQKGFQGLLFLVDTSTNKCFSISLWESEAEMKAHEASGHHGEQLAKGAHLMVAPQQIVEQRQYYEVALLA